MVIFYIGFSCVLCCSNLGMPNCGVNCFCFECGLWSKESWLWLQPTAIVSAHVIWGVVDVLGLWQSWFLYNNSWTKKCYTKFFLIFDAFKMVTLHWCWGYLKLIWMVSGFDRVGYSIISEFITKTVWFSSVLARLKVNWYVYWFHLDTLGFSFGHFGIKVML